MKQQYQKLKFRATSILMIKMVNMIVDEYKAAGLSLTVRQIYYQLVARGVIPNDEKSYANVKKVVNNGRLAGMIDWDAIEDRTRRFYGKQRFNSGLDMMRAAYNAYHIDMWKNQSLRVYVMVEKDALFNVFQSVCGEYDVPLMANRGYPSSSVLREFAQKQIIRHERHQKAVLLHFGDHDPSGVDMSRDLIDRMELFSESSDIEFVRVALNMDQIKEHDPPPNPAKLTDSRVRKYIHEHGKSSWELDALNPTILRNLALSEIDKRIDKDAWAEREALVAPVKARIALATAFFFGGSVHE